jgi:hypothetical protein
MTDGASIRISGREDNLQTGEGQACSRACEETSSYHGSCKPTVSAPFHRNWAFFGCRLVFVIFCVYFEVELLRRNRSLVVCRNTG